MIVEVVGNLLNNNYILHLLIMDIINLLIMEIMINLFNDNGNSGKSIE